MLFAGITVIISLLGLMAMGLKFVNGLAISGSLAVLVMMLAALTLLPALLGFAGTKIDDTSRAAGIAVGVFVVIASSACSPSSSAAARHRRCCWRF